MGIWQTAEWSSGRVRVALSPSLPPPYTNQICRSENWLWQPDRNGIIKSPTPTLHGDEMRLMREGETTSHRRARFITSCLKCEQEECCVRSIHC